MTSSQHLFYLPREGSVFVAERLEDAREMARRHLAADGHGHCELEVRMMSQWPDDELVTILYDGRVERRRAVELAAASAKGFLTNFV